MKGRFAAGWNRTAELPLVDLGAVDAALQSLAVFGDDAYVVVRFWRNVVRTDDCWWWIGPTDDEGYGLFYVGTNARPKMQRAYRVAWQMLRGLCPEGLVPDHQCVQPGCVNPDHLEWVPQRVNALRSSSPVARNARKTHCIRGHELLGTNLYVVPGKGWRQCKRCRAAAQRRAKERRIASA